MSLTDEEIQEKQRIAKLIYKLGDGAFPTFPSKKIVGRLRRAGLYHSKARTLVLIVFQKKESAMFWKVVILWAAAMSVVSLMAACVLLPITIATLAAGKGYAIYFLGACFGSFIVFTLSLGAWDISRIIRSVDSSA